MPLWLKLAAVAVFIAIIVAVRFGADAFFTWSGPGVTLGFVLGMLFTAAMFVLTDRLDRRKEP